MLSIVYTYTFIFQQLNGWFHRLGSKGKATEGGGGGDAFKGIKQQMLKVSKGRPRGMPNYKFWMSHPLYKEKFTIAYEAAKALNPPEPRNRIKFQCEVAEELYEQEPAEVKEAIAIENEESRSSKSAVYKRLLAGKFTLEGADKIDEDTKKL